MSRIQLDAYARTLVTVADTLIGRFDLVEFMHDFTERAADLTGSAAVGVMLAQAGDDLAYMGASNEEAKTLELFQLAAHEGPCLDAFHTVAMVAEDHLDRSEQWPMWTSVALAQGMLAVHAFPLRVHDQAIGAVGLFARERAPLTEVDCELAQGLADVASIAIMQQRTVEDALVVKAQLQRALDSRIIIEQAKGIVAQAYDVDVNDAFKLIRAYSRAQSVRLADFAHRLVTSKDTVEELRSVM